VVDELRGNDQLAGMYALYEDENYHRIPFVAKMIKAYGLLKTMASQGNFGMINLSNVLSNFLRIIFKY
jgi:hypothetical protein